MRYLTLKKYALQTLGDKPGSGVGTVVKEVVDSLPDYKLFEVALHETHMFNDISNIRATLKSFLINDLANANQCKTQSKNNSRFWAWLTFIPWAGILVKKGHALFLNKNRVQKNCQQC